MKRLRKPIFFLSLALIIATVSCKKQTTDDPKPKTGNDSDSIILNQVAWKPYTNTPWESNAVTDVSIYKGNYYVGTKVGIYTSTDGTNYTLQSNIGSTTPNVHFFSFENYFFVLENQGNLHSFDGNKWTKTNLPTSANLQSIEHCKMVQNEKKDLFLYIRNSNGANQLYHSTDGAATWVSRTVPNNCIDVNTYYPNDLVAISKTEIFQSTDNGGNWTLKSSGYKALETIASNSTKKEIYTFDLQNKVGYRGDLDNIMSISDLESQTILGFSKTGGLYISNLQSEDNTFLQFSNNSSAPFSPFAVGLSSISKWSLEGEKAIVLSSGMVMQLDMNSQLFTCIGTPLGNVVDWQIKGKKEVILYGNTMLATSDNNGKTWLIGSNKAPQDRANCLFVDDINEIILVGTNKGVFSTDYRGISALEYHQHGLGSNFYIAAIAKQGANIALGINRNDNQEGAIAFNSSNSLQNFKVYQIQQHSDYAIHSLDIKSSVLFAKIYNPNHIVWYQAINSITVGSLNSWSFNKYDWAGGNPEISRSSITSSGFGIALYTGNKIIFSSNSKAIHGVHTLSTNNFGEMKRLFLNDDFTARAVIGNSIVESTEPLATVIEL